MTTELLSTIQLKRGVAILVAFVLLRAALTRFEPLSLEATPQSVLWLVAVFLIMSVGLVYLGFTRWVRVDLRQWWRYDRKKVLRDVGWGILGLIIAFILTALYAAAAVTLGLVEVPTQTSVPSLAEILLMQFFGFAIAGFQEETIFRGFVQDVLTERLGRWQGNILQGAIFSLAHIGYYPLDAWPMFLQAFLVGIVFGWLRMKRGTLIAPWIAHGFFG